MEEKPITAEPGKKPRRPRYRFTFGTLFEEERW
jgi:hypothetical protein